MNVLIDHCTWHNLGDVAMVEGVVRRYIQTSQAVCHVVDRQALDTTIWGLPRTYRAPDVVARRWVADRLPGSARFIWRLELLDLLATGRWDLDRRRPLLNRPGQSYDDYCRPYDALHLVGGGFLNDVLIRLLFDKCTLINAFAAQNKPVVLTGQELGPFRYGIARNALYRALRNCAFVGVRDPGDSARHCRQAGLDARRYAIMPDGSFGLEPAALAEVRDLLAQYGLAPGQFIAANVRLGSYRKPGQQLRWVAALLGRLSEQLGLPVLVVPLAFTAGDDDVAAGQQVAARAGGCVRVLDRKDLSAARAKGVLGQAHLAVGTSYHFCTFALCGGVPAVCLFDGRYYAHKAAGLVGLWNDERLALQLDSQPPEVAARDLEAMANDDTLRAALADRSRQLAAVWEEGFEVACRAAFGGTAALVPQADAIA